MESMKKDDLKAQLNMFLQAVCDHRAEINLMMVNQNNNRKHRYHGLMLKTTLIDVQESIVKSIEYLEKEITNKTLDKYDLEISLDESIQMVNASNVIHGEEILSELTVDYSHDVVSETTDLSRIKFIIIQLYYEGQSIYLFKRYVQPTTTYKTSEKYEIQGGTLKAFTGKIITISHCVDAFLLNGVYYIFNRNTFNSIFAYRDIFEKIIEDNAPMIMECGLMKDATEFIMDCKSDGRYLTRLTKIILAKGFEEASKNKTGIKKIVEEYNLSLSISDSDEIIYRNKEDIPEILNLLLKHYVTDALTNDKMIAAAIQRYNAGEKMKV